MLDVPVVKERTFNVGFNQLWSGLILAITKEGGSIKTVDKESGLIVFSKNISSSEAKIFGVYSKGSRVMRRKVRGGVMEVNVIVQRMDEHHTKIHLLPRIRVTVESIGSSESTYVPSSGEFERRFFYMIDRMTGGGSYGYLFE